MKSENGHQRQLDARERTYLVDSGRDGLRLFLRGLRSTASPRRGVVLYLHGATFPSALSVAYRFDGVSWRDALCRAGFDVWVLDFLGFGGSDRYLEMEADTDAHAPLGLAADALAQVEAAVRFILAQGDHQQVSLVTHSWGSMPAGLFAANYPTWSTGSSCSPRSPVAKGRVIRYARYRRRGTSSPMISNGFASSRTCRPANRPCSRTTNSWPGRKPISTAIPPHAAEAPPAVKTPTGPLVEILRAWHGELAWEPGDVQAPVAIIRGLGWAGHRSRRSLAVQAAGPII
jgi:pimeloyl-ACP methyl ester carboxylesterase